MAHLKNFVCPAINGCVQALTSIEPLIHRARVIWCRLKIQCDFEIEKMKILKTAVCLCH